MWEERKKQVDYLFANREGLTNEKGRSRTFEENRVCLLAMITTMQLWLHMVKDGSMDVLDWSWTHFDICFSRAIKMKQQHISTLRRQFTQTGEVLVFG